MNALFTLTATTLVEHCNGRSDQEISAACDVALTFLSQQGYAGAALRRFLPAVRREILSQQRVVHASLTTPAGKSGTAKAHLLSSLEKTLDARHGSVATDVARVDLQEHADVSLIGGAILAVGNERLDGSIRGALRQLSVHLTT